MSKIQTQTQLYLNNLEFPYEILPCDQNLADTQAFCKHYDLPLSNSANAILVKAKKDQIPFALCVLLATHRLQVNKVVRKKMGAPKASFAAVDETRQLTGMEIGGVTPIGLPKALPIWVDAQVMECDYIILGGGNRQSKLKVAPAILELLPTAEIIEELAT